MILHLIESGRHAARPTPPALWSMGAHGALVLALAGDGLFPRDDAADEVARRREVVYFLPLLPSRPPIPEATDLVWQDGTVQGALDGAGTVSVPVGAPGARAGGGAAPRRDAAAPVDSGPTIDTSPVYLEAQLDQPVERDPRSAGPVYPEALRLSNTEGSVIAEWVVDTIGVADQGSFRVVSTTHPLFTEAVRAVLPEMYFRPAELGGRRVRQLVRQEFRFQLQLPVVAHTDSSGTR